MDLRVGNITAKCREVHHKARRVVPVQRRIRQDQVPDAIPAGVDRAEAGPAAYATRTRIWHDAVGSDADSSRSRSKDL